MDVRVNAGGRLEVHAADHEEEFSAELVEQLADGMHPAAVVDPDPLTVTIDADNGRWQYELTHFDVGRKVYTARLVTGRVLPEQQPGG